MADMNELLEEAEGHCTSLSDELDTAVAAVDAMEINAKALYEHASSGTTNVRERLQGLTARLESAGHALESARVDTVSGLDSLVERATEVRTDVGGLLDDVRGQLEQVRVQQEQLDLATGEDLQAMSVDHADLRARIRDTQESIAGQLEEARDSVGRFRGALELAQATLADKQSASGEALDALEAMTRERTRTLVGALQEALGSGATSIVDLANRMLGSHNAAMADLQQVFGVEAGEQAAAWSRPLQDTLAEAGDHAVTHAGELAASTEGALGRVRAILPVLHELTLAFEQSRRLS